MTASPDDARALTDYEAFSDPAYYGMWAVRKAGSRAFSETVHVLRQSDAEALITMLTEARIQGARDALKPAPHLDELTALSQEIGLYGATALSEARDQGARGFEAAYREGHEDAACGGGIDADADWPKSRTFRSLATPSPAISPLREAVVPPEPWPGCGPDFNYWNTDLRAFIDVLGKFDWTREWRFKYVELRVDTRNGAFLVYDRDRVKATPDDIAKHVRAAQGAAEEERTP